MSFNIIKIGTLCTILTLLIGEATPAVSSEFELKGYDATPSGLIPVYPTQLLCPQLSSLYGSWEDVDGSNREERHVGVDGGCLGDEILAPADGTLIAIWKRNRELGGDWSILIAHSPDDLNIKDEGSVYYSEFDHLRFEQLSHLNLNQRISRGQRIAFVDRPGGNRAYLAEVHWEVYEVPEADKNAIIWKIEGKGDVVWWNYSARLIDPLYFMPIEKTNDGHYLAHITPYSRNENYSSFVGFTYILGCR
ncbi:MAG: M23 family metallopeptidase [Halopseudomonas aestusnigri]